MNSNWSCHPENLKSEPNCRFSSFVYHFVAICEFKLELQSRNPQFWSKQSIFRPVWPWNLTDDLEKNRVPLLCYFKLCASFCSHLWIQTGVQSENSQIGAKFVFTSWDLDLWCLTLTFWTNFGGQKMTEIGVSSILRYMLGRNDHLQNWWDFGHGLMIFLLLVHFWPSEMDQICFLLGIFWRTHGRDGLKRGSGGIFLTLCTESCLVCHWSISGDCAIADALFMNTIDTSEWLSLMAFLG